MNRITLSGVSEVSHKLCRALELRGKVYINGVKIVNNPFGEHDGQPTGVPVYHIAELKRGNLLLAEE